MNIKTVFSSTKTNTLNGPAFLNKPPLKYEPVDCHFTDELEFLAVKRIPIMLHYLDEQLLKRETTGIIKDIYIQKKEEYLELSSGKSIRLDHLITLTINEN